MPVDTVPQPASPDQPVQVVVNGQSAPSSDAQLPPAQPPTPDPIQYDPWCDPQRPRVVQFQDISAAAFKIKSGIMMVGPNQPFTKFTS